MRDDELRALLQLPAPGEEEAERRAWETVRTAFEARERLPRERHLPLRAALALALLAAAVGLAVSPAGPAVGGWIRDTIGRERVIEAEPSPPGLDSLPAAGRLLVASPRGLWVVAEDGSKRFLGAYEGASWSPRGLFVVAWRGRQLVALDPAKTGVLRWSLVREEIEDARWAPSGYRVAYRSGAALRVVAGDGTGDSELAARVAPVAPAWKPGPEHVLAFVDPSGRVRVVDTDARRTLLHSPRLEGVLELEWAGDGATLLVLAERALLSVAGPRGRHSVELELPPGLAATAFAVRPGTGEVAYATFSAATGRSSVSLHDPSSRESRLLFAGGGVLRDLAWSPDGRFVLVGWEMADQWLFVPTDASARVLGASGIARQFDPGSRGAPGFPRVEGWCCA